MCCCSNRPVHIPVHTVNPSECLAWHSGARVLAPSRLFHQRPQAANVQWLASPTVVPELGGDSRLLNWGHSGLAATSSTLGGGPLGRTSQRLLPIESGAFRHSERWEQMNQHPQLVRDQTKRTRR